jgi:hypothetical protein
MAPSSSIECYQVRFTAPYTNSGVTAMTLSSRWRHDVVPFLLTIIVLPAIAVSQSMCGCESRYDLLMELYNTTNGSQWVNRGGWGVRTPCATPWYGVSCNGWDVDQIALPSNSLTGTLPDSWGGLSGLMYLYLYNNSLSFRTSSLST